LYYIIVVAVAAAVARVKTSVKMEVDEALAKLGTIGRWQVRYFSMISAASMVLPCFHMLAINYIGECICVVHASV